MALLGSALAAPARADDPASGFAFSAIPPTDDAMWSAYNRAGGKKCKTSDCVALDTILETGQIIFESAMTTTWIGDSSPAGEAYVAARMRPSVVNRRLRITLLSHPDRFPSICTRISNLVSLYEPNLTPLDEHFVSVGLLQMALLIDMKHQQNCLADALAALPRTPDADESIVSARGFCEGAQWHVTACKLITR